MYTTIIWLLLSNMQHNIGKFCDDLRVFLRECEDTEGKQNKANIACKLFDYLVDNMEIVNLPKMANFKKEIRNKLIEYKVESDVIDGKKYFNIMFPGEAYGDNNTNTEEEAIKAITPETFNEHWEEEKQLVGVDKIPNVDTPLVNDNIVVDIPLVNNNIVVVDTPLVKNDVVVDTPLVNKNNIIDDPNNESLKIIPLLIVEYYETNKFDKIIFDTDIFTSVKLSKGDNIIVIDCVNNDVMKSITNYDNVNKDNINTNFLIKINDEVYELYEKVVTETMVKGYIYNSKTTNVTFIKKCRYGIVYL